MQKPHFPSSNNSFSYLELSRCYINKMKTKHKSNDEMMSFIYLESNSDVNSFVFWTLVEQKGRSVVVLL